MTPSIRPLQTIIYTYIYIYIYIHIHLRIIYLYFWLCWVFVAARELFFCSCSKQGLLSSCIGSHCHGFSCCRAQALGLVGFSSFGFQALHHRLSRCIDLIVPRHVESSWTRDQTHVSCIGRCGFLFFVFFFTTEPSVCAMLSCSVVPDSLGPHKL